MESLIINEYIYINSSIVQIQQFGFSRTYVPPQKDLTDYDASSRSDDETYDHVILFLPGNPGILGYYHDFNKQLYNTLNSSSSRFKLTNVPIFAISHNNFDYPAWNHDRTGSNNLHTLRDYSAGHSKLPSPSSINNDPNHIELQVHNKIVILKKLFDLTRTKLTIIGHSIGCYVILRMLQDANLNASTTQIFFIHPALENLALTEKGTYWATMFKYKIDWFIGMFCLLLDSILPDSLRPGLASWIKPGDFKNLSKELKVALVQLSTYRILQSTITMAKSEFRNIKDLNPSLFDPVVEKTKIYYAQKDHWVNSSHRQILKEKFPNLSIKEREAMHAFTLNPRDVDYYISELVPAIIEKLEEE